jgi:hypothetical protein
MDGIPGPETEECGRIQHDDKAELSRHGEGKRFVDDPMTSFVPARRVSTFQHILVPFDAYIRSFVTLAKTLSTSRSGARLLFPRDPIHQGVVVCCLSPSPRSHPRCCDPTAMDPFISGGWSDDEYELDNSAAGVGGGPDEQDDVSDDPENHNRYDDGRVQGCIQKQQAHFNPAEPHTSFDDHQGDADDDDDEHHAPHRDNFAAYNQGQQHETSLEGDEQINRGGKDDHRLALVGVINHDDSIRVQVLATPPPKPPRLPSLPSSLTAGFQTASRSRSPRHAKTTTDPSSDSHPPTTSEESMRKLQETSVQKREERAEVVHSISATIAHATAQVATENLQREASIRNLHCHLGQLVEESMDRMALRQDVLHNRVEQVHTLEQQLTRMDARMTKALHADTCVHWQSILGSLQKRADDLSSTRQRWNEACLSTDAAAFRTTDRVTSDLSRHWLEERCARMAAIELAGYQIQERDWDPHASRQYLEHIQDLRDRIRHERHERQRNDATVKDRIVRATSSLKRAMLHLAVDAPYKDGVEEESMLNVDVEEEIDEAIARRDYLGA